MLTAAEKAEFAQKAISDDALESYERDGAVILRDVIPSEWIERMRTAIDRMMAEGNGFEMASASDPGRFFGDSFLWRRDDEFKAFLFESPLANLAGRMMRASKVNLFYDQLFVKEPGTAARTPWHQDLPYWPVSGWQVTSIWVPFDRATPESGVVTYIKGSHLWGKLFQPRSFGATPVSRPVVYDEVPDIDEKPQEFEFITGMLNPGDAFVHHARTIHGAPGNASAHTRRRALAVRWTGDDAVYAPRPGHFLENPRYDGLRKFLTCDPGTAMDCDLFPVVARPGKAVDSGRRT